MSDECGEKREERGGDKNNIQEKKHTHTHTVLHTHYLYYTHTALLKWTLISLECHSLTGQNT